MPPKSHLKRDGAKKKPAAGDFLASHQRSWVWGRRAVLEILDGGRWPVRELHLAQRLDAGEQDTARRLAARWNTDVRVEPAERLTELCQTPGHQGYLARMGPYPYLDLDRLLSDLTSSRREAPAFMAMLDRLRDPFNFGAIIRSAEAFALDALIIGEQAQAGVNSQVVRSSAGAVNRLAICRVGDLREAARRLDEKGFALAAADETAPDSIGSLDFSVPTVMLLGNESDGVAPDLKALCHRRVRIPQQGAVGSLNVAAAAAVCFYEARRCVDLRDSV